MKKISPFILIIIGIGIIALIFFGNTMFKTLKPGERGVVFKKFTTGLNKENILKSGFHIIAPWHEMYVYNIKERSRKESLDVFDKVIDNEQ